MEIFTIIGVAVVVFLCIYAFVHILVQLIP